MKSYRQYCGLARAAELLGERWTLLLVRDLLVGAKRFNELRTGIPGIPSKVLTDRLRELEESGVVERGIEGRGVVYRLTEYGRDLEPIVAALGLWGARRMDAPREGEVPTDDSLAAALMSSRTAARVSPFTVEVSAGPATAHAQVRIEGVEVGAGPLDAPDLRVAGVGVRRLLADGDIDAALRSQGITVEGDRDLLDQFAAAFRAPLDDGTRSAARG